MNNFHSILVKTYRKGYLVNSRAFTSSVEIIDTIFEAVLMGKRKGDTILLFESKDKSKSWEFAEEWSNKTGIAIKPYGENSRENYEHENI